MNSKKRLAHATQKNVDLMAEMEGRVENARSFGEKMSDRLAVFVGSWYFILCQTCLVVLWIGLNALMWIQHWDPYPFILLNLALSIQTAATGPIILMSQNRQMRLAERRHQLDLQINLLAEQENTEMFKLVRLLCKRLGVSEKDLAAAAHLTEDTAPRELVEQIEQTAKKAKGSADDNG
jgi:uncharacterized membrane protein